MSFTPIWGVPIAMYLFLAGLGGGAFVTSFVIGLKSPEAAESRKFGHYLGFIVVAIGLVLLMFDAHAGFMNPLRFALLLTNFGSVMTWGVAFLAGFMIVDLVVCILDLKKMAVPFWLDVVGVVFSLCVGVYTGALLGVAHTFPLWNSALLPILFLVSAISTGAAAVILYAALAKKDEFAAMGWTKKAHYLFPIVEVVLVAALLFITYYNGDAGMASALNLLAGPYAVMFWLGFIVIGLVAPFAIETYATFVKGEEFEDSQTGRTVTAVADAGVIVGGLLLRYMIVVAALPVTMTVAAVLA